MRAGSSASLKLTLSEAAKLSIKLERKSTGRKVGKSCVTATHANRKRKSCTRYTSAGSAVKKSGLNGANALKLATTRLKAGAYRLTITATDAAGNASKATLTLTVTAAKRKH